MKAKSFRTSGISWVFVSRRTWSQNRDYRMRMKTLKGMTKVDCKAVNEINKDNLKIIQIVLDIISELQDLGDKNNKII